MTKPIILIRPLAQSNAFAKRIDEALPGRFTPLIAPLIEIVEDDPYLPVDGAQALLFSSAQGVQSFAARSPIRNLPALCVGDRTAQVAAALGFSAESAQGDAAALAQLAASSYLPDGGHMLYLRGNPAAGDVAGALMAEGIPTEEVILYHQRPLALCQAAQDVLAGRQQCIIPVFSQNAGLRLREALAEAPPMIAPIIVAISDAALAPCADLQGAALHVAAQPSADGVLHALAQL